MIGKNLYVCFLYIHVGHSLLLLFQEKDAKLLYFTLGMRRNWVLRRLVIVGKIAIVTLYDTAW